MAGKKRRNDDSPVKSDSPKKARRPMRCRSCEGAPLIKDCGCRKKPRTQGKNRVLADRQTPPLTSGMSQLHALWRERLADHDATAPGVGEADISRDLQGATSLLVVSLLFTSCHTNP